MRPRTIITVLLTISMAVLSGCEGTANEVVPSDVSAGRTDCNDVVFNTLTEGQKWCYDRLASGFRRFDEEIIIAGEAEDVEIAYSAITADRPELFYVTGYVYNTKKPLFSNITEVTIYPSYSCLASEYEASMVSVEKEVKKWLEAITPDMSDYDKAQRLFEDVVMHNEYSKSEASGQNITSTFLNGKAVCGGYAQGYSYMMQRAGIPCAAIPGTLDGVPHMWTLSVLDGDYYVSDPTNGDASYVDASGEKGTYVDYSYFNISPSFIPERYVPEPQYAEFAVTATQNGYFVHNGTEFDKYSQYDFNMALIAAENAGFNALHVQFTDKNELKAAMKDLFTGKVIMNMMPDAEEINYVTTDKMNTLTVFLPGSELDGGR